MAKKQATPYRRRDWPDGVYPLRVAAEIHGIPYRTLFDRIKRHPDLADTVVRHRNQSCYPPETFQQALRRSEKPPEARFQLTVTQGLAELHRGQQKLLSALSKIS